MGLPKLYPDKFTNDRRLVWCRSRSQARYRGEEWSLSFDDFCRLWSTESLWLQRGRHNDGLVLFRYDAVQPWQLTNCCIITRVNQLRISAARKAGKSDETYLKEAIWV